MIVSNKLRLIHDYQNSSDCFPEVDIKGGVSYFLYDNNYDGECAFIEHNINHEISQAKRHLKIAGCNVLIRYNELISIAKYIIYIFT